MDLKSYLMCYSSSKIQWWSSLMRPRGCFSGCLWAYNASWQHFRVKNKFWKAKVHRNEKWSGPIMRTSKLPDTHEHRMSLFTHGLNVALQSHSWCQWCRQPRLCQSMTVIMRLKYKILEQTRVLHTTYDYILRFQRRLFLGYSFHLVSYSASGSTPTSIVNDRHNTPMRATN